MGPSFSIVLVQEETLKKLTKMCNMVCNKSAVLGIF